MKQWLTVIQAKKFLISLLFTISGIWLLGPYLAIAGKPVLANFSHRIIASLVAFLLFFIIEYQKSETTFTTDIPLPDEIKQELHSLQKTLHSLINTLYGNFLKSFIFKYKKPWYLVLGPTNAGKSTLLNKANINITGLDKLPPMMITPTKAFNWWLADDAVLIDVGGKYLKDHESAQYTHLLFQQFFKLIKKYRSYRPIDGLILTINLQELTVNTKDQPQLKNLTMIINELVLQFVHFPIYLFITRCDTIEGFTEFFEDLAPEERNQIFGLHFPLDHDSMALPQLFNEQFNALLSRLNERVIWRLHKEHHLDKIGKIKNFPLQMEYLKTPLAKLLNLIIPNTHLNLRGIFFTSAQQKDVPFDNLTKTLSHAYNIHHLHQSQRPAQAKTFFISELFKRVILPESKFYTANNPDNRLQFVASLFMIIITGTCIFLFFNSYHYNIETLKNTQQAIQLLNQPSTVKHDPIIKRLDMLHNVIHQLDNQEGAWYNHIGMRQADNLRNKTEVIYNKLLTTEFLPYLQRTLEIQLQNTPNENINQLYATLKTYLMLSELKRLDPKFFTAWFDNYWQQLHDNPIKLSNLNNHLTALFKQGFKAQTVNPQLIASKRNILTGIPQSRLVLTILQNQYQRSPIKLATNSELKIFNDLPTEVPGIYNIQNFQNVYYKEITNTCQEITHGDWVLGKQQQTAFSNISLNQLATEVKAIYLNEYSQVWSEILTKIKLDNIKNLDQVVMMLELLNNPQSPLVQLINTIRDNTQPISDSVEFTQQISSRFIALTALSADLLKNSNQSSLSGVKQYLGHIVRAADRERASYEAAKQRMENQNNNDALTTLLQQARLLPEPLQTWHTTLAAESWRILLQSTQNYLNRIWTTTVYPQYQAILDKRYPLFKEAATEISLNDFSNFFGYYGTMDNFFKNYLQPFVDNSRLYWEWKNVDGQRINISQANLEMFIRAALIQKMFFPEDARTPSITFSLVPIDLDPAIQTFNLDVEGQQLVFQKDNEQIISLTWPGPQPSHAEMTFVDNQGKKTVIAETGQWAWFKILDKSLLEATNSPKHFKVTFVLNGSMVHYELYTNGIVNPFIPGILNAFRCPENL